MVRERVREKREDPKQALNDRKRTEASYGGASKQGQKATNRLSKPANRFSLAQKYRSTN